MGLGQRGALGGSITPSRDRAEPALKRSELGEGQPDPVVLRTWATGPSQQGTGARPWASVGDKAGIPPETADLKSSLAGSAAIVPSLQSGAPTSCYFRRQEMTPSHSLGPPSAPAGLPTLGPRS